MADIDVNERLTGLINLLHVVGIDGVDPDALAAEQAKLKRGGSTSTSTTAQSSDSQILELIKKLKIAQADSPEILAALKSPELRALATLAAQAQAKPAPAPAPSLDDVMDDDDNYPKIGPGYSDDISVVSDLTTPTVMTKQHVMEEEFYKDVNGGPGSLPPMHIGLGPGQPSRPPGAIGAHGGGGGGFAPKTRNLVSQVKPNAATRRAIAKTGGAAAQRRLNYQQAMAKLQSSEYGTSSGPKQDKSYMEMFSPKTKPALFKPTSPTPSKMPSELPSLTEQTKLKSKQQTRNKSAVKEKKGKKVALSAQEVDDFELDSDPMAPKYDQVPDSGASHSSGGRRKKEKPAAEKSASQEIEWGGSEASAWPAFGESTASDDKLFVDDDGFFPSSDVFGKSSPFATASSSGSGRSPAKPKREGDAKPRKPKVKDGERKTGDRVKKSSKGRKASLAM
eukprot:CAMPEP_0176133568 /NCGR_PEP_ID=MMETSP0120_2-20121206/67713_1 /TAXON_ID=160619 /ORGANISM="Kryptoperidinium foliaceum, Strain CCMP 1326" /LENGTH=449 /DNA_ID=CAMNT_0017469159 /DNA_START=30 /DNA_END=1379 /DNA_ORIENTATION=+